MDDDKIQIPALSWLYEMELLSVPSVQNNLKENILLVDEAITNCELMIIESRKEILVYLELTRLAKFFKRDRKIIILAEEVLEKLLPSFRKRIITDKVLFDSALSKVKAFYGGKNEKITTINNDIVDVDNTGNVKLSPISTNYTNILSDHKK